MTDSSAEDRAGRHDRLAQVMELTEARMHSTADVLPEPNRSRRHSRADEISDKARSPQERAEEIREGCR